MLRKLGIVAICIVALIGGAIAWWKFNYPSYSYRYRLAVEVEVDGKVHRGAGVIEVTIRKQPELGSAPPQVVRVKGEAVFVDLGGGRNVIALLATGLNASDLGYPAYVTTKLFGLSYADQDLARTPFMQGRRAIPASFLPTLVTFSDLSDPKSARVVQPHEFPDVFGEGIRFRGATIELTRDEVTRGIIEQLPWWSAPGRPASIARRAWRTGPPGGPSIEPETLFVRH